MFRLDELMDLISTPIAAKNEFGFKFNILDPFSQLRGLPVVFDLKLRPDYTIFRDTICGFTDDITQEDEHILVHWYASDDRLGRVIEEVLSKITPVTPPIMTPISRYMLDFVGFQIHMHTIIGFRLS